MLSRSRTPVERTRNASTTRSVSQDLQTRDIDVCATLDSRANTATKVQRKKVARFTICASRGLILVLKEFFLRNAVFNALKNIAKIFSGLLC